MSNKTNKTNKTQFTAYIDWGKSTDNTDYLL
jgi:hypothetical protein